MWNWLVRFWRSLTGWKQRRELVIDDLTFPLFPGLSHSGSLAGP
jgi:hypothetical protein